MHATVSAVAMLEHPGAVTPTRHAWLARLDSVNTCIILDGSSFVTTHVEPALTPCLTVVARQGRAHVAEDLNDDNDNVTWAAVVHCINVVVAPAADTVCVAPPLALGAPAAAR
ncbi:hypothetical protein HaLaN_21209 [Haematococcus lacustris]|uniref:Uncharacterized protein n=1 Tax=Haematococcus lacustris TaxID=44745 RepID=A0A699ZVC4_HAELA|nr:hypothetical protein HaLaN_21209 [Haematococcus lacustris]